MQSIIAGLWTATSLRKSVTKREFPFTGYGNKPGTFTVNDNTAPNYRATWCPSILLQLEGQCSGPRFRTSLWGETFSRILSPWWPGKLPERDQKHLHLWGNSWITAGLYLDIIAFNHYLKGSSSLDKTNELLLGKFFMLNNPIINISNSGPVLLIIWKLVK